MCVWVGGGGGGVLVQASLSGCLFGRTDILTGNVKNERPMYEKMKFSAIMLSNSKNCFVLILDSSERFGYV